MKIKGLAQRSSTAKGFTLVELLIVVAVIGILATVLIVAVNPAKQLQKSRDTTRKSALKTLQSALEQYYADNGTYPTSDCWSGTSGCWRLTAGSFLGTNAANYLSTLPTDPRQFGSNCGQVTSYGFNYDYDASIPGYRLSTRLENTTDSQITTVTGCSTMNYLLTNQQ